MNNTNNKTSSDLLKKGYNSNELFDIFSLALLKYDLEEYKAALDIVNGLLYLNPDFIDCYYLKLASYLGLKEYQKLYDYADRLLINNPDDIKIKLLKITAYIKDSRYLEAGTELGEISDNYSDLLQANLNESRFFKLLLKMFSVESKH